MTDDDTRSGLYHRIGDFLATHDPLATERKQFLSARYDAGLAWVHFPAGHGGLDLPRALQSEVDELFAAAGAPDNDPHANGIGLGMAAPTILAFGTEEQKRRFLKPLWTGEEKWCQLFSEPGAGSDLAGLSTRAVRTGDEWVVNGQKVWTSSAHRADWGILVARSNPDVVKHAGLTYFLCDMKAPGIDVRPLRQLTGEAEFNEVFFSDVRIPDSHRIGGEGEGWKVATATLNNERVAIGSDVPRESGMIGVLSRAWRDNPALRTSDVHSRLLRLWVEAEAVRLTGVRLREKLAVGQPGPEGSAMKLAFASIAQRASGLEVEMLGEAGLRFTDWTLEYPERVNFTGRDAGYRYLRAKGNSIEGGTSEILRNVIAEQLLGLPAEPRADAGIPWKDLPR